jgi:catechol 2,3-dioxygenase
MTTDAQSTPITAIDAATQVGLLSLSVADLDRSLRFYTTALGFELLERAATAATLGVDGRPLLLLSEQRGAIPWPRERASYPGLYHFAILLPTRADLGRWLRHWLELGLPIPGQGDHLVSEALYLEDPDGHGIEVYRDRPREDWPRVNGQIRMATDPVDLRGVLAEGDQVDRLWNGLPAGTRLGHMHLQVGDIAQAAAFYQQVLGFETMARMPSALFIAAGGYHHHLGLNTWHSRGAGPAPAEMVRLRFFTIDLPTADALQAVVHRLEAAGVAYRRTGDVVLTQDPWQNTILLKVGATSDAQAARALTEAFSAAGGAA